MTNVRVKEAVDRVFIRFHECAPQEFTANTSTVAFAVGGLTNKALSHCEIAKDLVFKNRLSEAVILLRAAYEAVVIMHYLLKHPGKLIDYQNHGVLVRYKDRLMSLHTSEFKDKASAKKKIRKAKEALLKIEILNKKEFFRITRENKKLFEDGSILDNPFELAPAIKNYFTSFRKMSEALLADFPDEYSNLQSGAITTYNLGSQVAHSQWHVVQEFNIGVDFDGNPMSPLYNNNFILFSMIALMDYCFIGMDEAHLSNDLRANLHSYLTMASTDILANIKANRGT